MDDRARLPGELRIALAMKGGVSLAVWMGGACREIARLREEGDGGEAAPADATTESSRYRALLRLCGYDKVLVDVLSGSSAGGLNGVLLSQNIASGARFDDGVRDVWLKVADLHRLARRPWADPPLSLLHGDQAFYRQLVLAMRQLQTSDLTRVSEHPLRLLVTATRLQGRRDALFPTAGSPLRARTNAGFIRFRYPGIADALYVSRETDHDHAINDFIESDFGRRRLAYAARTTSSFPGAFEPSAPWVLTDVPEQQVDLYGVSSETGTEDDEMPGRVELVDGGLLDNIPIAWAIRSIAGMPATAPVDRWLVYLEPVPDKDSTAAAADAGVINRDRPRSRSVLGMIKLVIASLRVKANTESVLDDAQALSEAAGLTSAQQAAMVATLSLAGSEGLRDAAGDQVDPTYVRLLGRMEIGRLRQLLLNPYALVAPDPLPLPPDTYPDRQVQALGESERTAPLLRPVSDDDAAALAGPLQSQDVQGQLGFKAQTPLVAARAVTLLMEAVRVAEQAGDHPEVAGLRSRLYAVRLAIEMTIAARDRILLRLADEHLRDGDGHPVAAPVALLRQATRELAALLAQLDQPPAETGHEAMALFWRRWAYDLAVLAVKSSSASIPRATAARGPGPDAGEPVTPYAMLWEAVLGCEEAFDLIDAPDRLEPTQHSRRATMGETLCSLEVLVGGLRPDPLSSPAVPLFAVMSATNRSPLEDRLLKGPITEQNRVNLKLSGNQVANFAGFLSARWRDNDWIWGRLDSAQTLVSLIAREDRVAAALAPDADSADPRRALREFFTGGAHDQEWAAFLGSRWQQLEQELVNGDRAVESWFVDVATERLHWDILATEIGWFHQLNDRAVGRDDPPQADGVAATVPPPRAQAGGAPGPLDRLRRVGEVGEETVMELLRRAELRRVLVQLGLVIWRAVVGTRAPEPPGAAPAQGTRHRSEPAWALVRRTAAWALAPTFLPALLLSLVSPFSTLLAGLLSWGAISAATGSWASAAHVPVILGLGLASFVFLAHLLLPNAAREHARSGVPLNGARLWLLRLVPATVIVVGIVFWTVALRLHWQFDVHNGWAQAAWGGLLAGGAFLATQLDVVWASLRRRTSRSSDRTVSPGLLLVSTAVVVVACFAVCLLPDHWLVGFAVQYVALALSLAGLYVWTERCATIQPPLGPEA
ncbi:hypothetical protein GCM10009841_14900 [Microlunatus panaciterrae]|uniref:Acylesterase/phospholipase RssA n=1 Tax=Microlunatus panaciterrae TaxID=400768 RepID=A0ABS2RM13_9ACTN|nr:patatin-like protein [Microlunatus panaciterrae]MBM7800050.1 putative acylesterase/phospholipase RssA [Microlunatus panaciterrae]